MKHNRSYDIILLVPGAPKRTAELIPSCDLIILPTGASRADLAPSLALARRIVEMKLTIDGPVFARCRIMTANEASEARATISNAGFETLDGELVERPGYRQAQNAGRNPTETEFPKLNGKARRLARSILDRRAWSEIPLEA